MNTVIESKHDQPFCIPQEQRLGNEKIYTNAKGWVKKSEFLDYIRTPKHGRGYTHLAVDMEAAYMCVCGFQGVFRSQHCARCGRLL